MLTPTSGKPGRVAASPCRVIVLALAATSARAVRHRHAGPSPTPGSTAGRQVPVRADPALIPTHNEVGYEVPDVVPPPAWSMIPSPYSEEMQKLASKGDMHAMHAVEKWPEWRQWKAMYRNISFPNVQTEVNAFRAFIENDMVIETHNADHASSYYSLGHSQWSAHSFHEFENLMFPVKMRDIMPPSYESLGRHTARDPSGKLQRVPESVDWSTSGAVSPVANQGECGSSWAFASTSAIESVCKIQGKTISTAGPLPLANQELVSCDVGTLDAPYADDGCDGGLPENAFGYVATSGGICPASDYPYASGNGHSYPCVHCSKKMTISGFKTVAKDDEEALMHAVAQQPVAVGIQANSMQLQLYKSGVFDSPSCGKEPDHVVLLVGYGTTSTNVPYWKLKNSWGTTWGDHGYFYLKRGVNQCGITSAPSYPFNCTAINGGDPRGTAPPPMPRQSECPTPRDGDIKLTSYPAGNLLIHFEGAWHPLCSQHLEIETAELMCKSLGYTTAWSFSDRTIPVRDAGPMFPSLNCDHRYDDQAVGGANILNMCSFRGAHTSDWLCELFGPAMAAYLVCHGTTPPPTVLTCGTSGWPQRNLQQYGHAPTATVARLREVMAARMAGVPFPADAGEASAANVGTGMHALAATAGMVLAAGLAAALIVSRIRSRDAQVARGEA